MISHSDGSYFFIETSFPRRPNDKARLVSSQQTAGTSCLSFYYNMYGQNVGALNVYVKRGVALGNPVFSQSGTKGQDWKSALVTITSAVQYQLVIEGVVGGGYLGDIAVDDITMTTGTCQTSKYLINRLS
ncbi:hypothetical protein DPMN_011690 [Dreissena polymorpha]|uniref:MAM domain-containing protein n=1 Tax=Dreissena polymorpha TaxID=45954 RepID=A0A9D4S2Q4_DREPO|nr:hypothetical protein DPMN_011690 [Dreissena polymorpha]